MIEFEIGSSGQMLVFSNDVLRHFQHHRQMSRCQREAGGQLFARCQTGRITVLEATGPRPTDRRSRTSYLPDRTEEQKEITTRHHLGLQFLGDWHTHPQDVPQPSDTDLTSISDCFRRSTHQMNGFVLAIVGRARLPNGLCVLVHDGTRGYFLQPKSAAVTSCE